MDEIQCLSIAYESKAWKVFKTISELSELFGKLLVFESKSLSKLSNPYDFTIASYINKIRGDFATDLINSFIKCLIQIPEVISLTFFKEFLEYSWFSATQTYKNKESNITLISTKSTSFDCCSWVCPAKALTKWLIVTEDYVGYTNSSTSVTFKKKLFFNQNFKIFATELDTGHIDGIVIRTSKNNLRFHAGSIQKKKEWVYAIKKALGNSTWNKTKTLYESSFPSRMHTKAFWYIDGENYFKAVYEGLADAKKQVFISAWWLCPEIHLLRPSEENPNSELVKVLNRLAEKGVQIEILIYKEIALLAPLNSFFTAETLRKSINKNIRIRRHPEHKQAEGSIFWAHNEKIICIDQNVAFLGGFDLCYGRFDTQSHKITDQVPPYTWSGIDYHNFRFKHYGNVKNHKIDDLNREKIPRMPWHDIGIRIEGAAARDVAIHFIEYWNFTITDKGSLLVEDLQTELIEQELEKKKKNLAEKYGLDWEMWENEVDLYEEHIENLHLSMCSKRKIKKFVYPKGLENYLNLVGESEVLLAQSDVSKRDEQDFKEQMAIRKKLVNNKQILLKSLLKPKKMENKVQQGSDTFVCELVRSVSDWSLGISSPESSIHNAYLTLIEKSQRFIYIENQYFLSSTGSKPLCNTIAQAIVDRIIRAFQESQIFMVFILLPLLPENPGHVFDPSSNIMNLVLHYTYKTISRGENSMFSQLIHAGITPSDYIRFYSLRTYDVLNGVPVTEMIYIHSKIMIIDDDIAIIGSANINDRSMVGTRDSEIAIVIKDSEKISSEMDEDPWVCGKFASGLRQNLFREFLGDQEADVLDPISDRFLELWESTAKKNTDIY